MVVLNSKTSSKMNGFTQALCLALAMGADAFAPSTGFFGTRSVALEARASSGAMSKFDRKKEEYKGEVKSVDPALSGFSYDDFGSYLEKQTYSFGRGDVVRGTVVQFEYQGALVDIGAKVSRALGDANAPQRIGIWRLA